MMQQMGALQMDPMQQQMMMQQMGAGQHMDPSQAMFGRWAVSGDSPWPRQ